MNYKEEIITGELTKWKRSNQVIISNSYNEIPYITFHEEDITVLPDGQVVHTQVSALGESMTDQLTEFNLIHPETGEVIGTAKYQDLYVMLYSLYMGLAKKRDEQIEAVPTEPVSELGPII